MLRKYVDLQGDKNPSLLKTWSKSPESFKDENKRLTQYVEEVKVLAPVAKAKEIP